MYCVTFMSYAFHSLSELGLIDGQEINVADPTTPKTLLFKLQMAKQMD